VHLVQTLALVMAENDPAVQFRQVAAELAADVAENLPVLQERQTLAVVAPKVPEYFPAVHAVQEPDTAASAYLPAEHCWQTLADEPPADAENCPAPHATHVELPELTLYDPAKHAVQELSPELAVIVPALQMLHTVAPAALAVPAKHVWQISAVVAPETAECLPALHEVHWLLLKPMTYVPAGHVLHVLLPAVDWAFPDSH
jgi:hypothetical protein